MILTTLGLRDPTNRGFKMTYLTPFDPATKMPTGPSAPLEGMTITEAYAALLIPETVVSWSPRTIVLETFAITDYRLR